MKTFILGNRGGSYGVFIAPPGIDAETATSDQLLLDISKNVNQIVLAGSSVSPFGPVILGLSYSPLVLLTSTANQNGVASGNVRPFGNVYYGTSYSSATVTAASMTIHCDFPSVGYLVFNKAI